MGACCDKRASIFLPGCDRRWTIDHKSSRVARREMAVESSDGSGHYVLGSGARCAGSHVAYVLCLGDQRQDLASPANDLENAVFGFFDGGRNKMAFSRNRRAALLAAMAAATSLSLISPGAFAWSAKAHYASALPPSLPSAGEARALLQPPVGVIGRLGSAHREAKAQGLRATPGPASASAPAEQARERPR